MQYTDHYNLIIFQANDVPTWLGSWNNTMTQIDSDMYSLSTQQIENKADIDVLEKQMSTANDEINELTGEMSDAKKDISANSANVAALQTTVSNQNNTIAGIQTQVDTVSELVGTTYRGVLSANETTLAITIGNYNDDSLVDIYASTYGIAPVTMELRPASGGQPNLCVTTWDAQASDVNVAVVIH